MGDVINVGGAFALRVMLHKGRLVSNQKRAVLMHVASPKLKYLTPYLTQLSSLPYRDTYSWMDRASPLSIPSSFDPAVYLHSDVNDNEDPIILPSCSNSDDLEAAHLQHEESNALKNQQGVVIRHRAWKTADVFRSEEDHLYGV